MTDYKEREGELKYRSLYIGLLYNVVKGLVFAVVIWLVIMLLSYYVIGVYFTTPDMKAERRKEYLKDLQGFVISNAIGEENAEEIAEWVRENPYVYLIVYYGRTSWRNGKLSPDGEVNEGNVSDDNTGNKPGELMGSRIDETLDRDQLVADATAGGYYRIELFDGGNVTVAIAEYTENLYYVTFNIISIAMAGLVFTLSLVRYIRVIIERIKRFESDVTIVSEIDMNYEIVSEGADEITNLSGKVEQMRQSMLHHIQSEKEARAMNAELIASISHDIRTPLTVLMGYIEMMKEHGGDEVMESYVSATESTAMRLKQLADDMFRYSLAYGGVEDSVKLEEYDARTLIEQLFSEHFLLMREMGYDVQVDPIDDKVEEGSIIRSDAPHLMRIVDNVFSNLRKYADINKPIYFSVEMLDSKLVLECKNTIRTDTEGAESNGIGLKTCKKLASLVAESFEYYTEGDSFICRLVIPIRER